MSKAEKKRRHHHAPPDAVEMAAELQRRFADKFIKAAGDGFLTGAVACELALQAILAERERCALITAKQDLAFRSFNELGAVPWPQWPLPQK